MVDFKYGISFIFLRKRNNSKPLNIKDNPQIKLMLITQMPQTILLIFSMPFYFRYSTFSFFGKNKSRKLNPPRKANIKYKITNKPSIIPVNQNVVGKSTTKSI